MNRLCAYSLLILLFIFTPIAEAQRVSLSGIYGVGAGGTGATTFSAGVMISPGGTTALSSVANVAAGQVLTSGTPAAWSATPQLATIDITSLYRIQRSGVPGTFWNVISESGDIISVGGISFGVLDLYSQGARRIRLDGVGNVMVGTVTVGTSAVGVLALGAATAPSTSPADVVQLWATDIAGAGTFGLNIRDEGGNVFSIGNGQMLVPAGTAALPGLAVGASGTGLIRAGSSLQLVTNGAVYATIGDTAGGNGFFVNGVLGFSTEDLYFVREAGNIFAQRNGANAQTFRGYGTFTNASNYERWSLAAVAATGITLAAETAGTGGDNLNVTLTPAGTGNVISAIGTGGLFQVGSTLRFGVTDGVAGTGTRIRTAQATVPTCTTNCGTTPSISGSDTAMVLTLGTGSPASPVTVTFNGTWATAPACNAANRTTAANSISRVDSTTTTAVVYFLAGPTASDLVAITCLGVS